MRNKENKVIKARELQKAGDAEMILTRYPERLEQEAGEAIEEENRNRCLG